MRAVELFAGVGGLASGLSLAGFRHDAVIEWDSNACRTIRENQIHRIEPLLNWKLFEADVSTFDYSSIQDGLDVVSGGPPCQPFSLGGKHRGHDDDRNMFPEAVRAVRELKPRAFIFENVKGLLRKAFAEYFEYILLQLTYPDINRKPEEDWIDHLSRLERYHTGGKHDGLFYNVTFRLLNAADYGVPQRRERVIIVGIRGDLDAKWAFPYPTHSKEALLRSQYVTGEYWEKHKVASKDRPDIPENVASLIEQLKVSVPLFSDEPWKTVRDAVGDLPAPEQSVSSEIPNHQYIPGARIYVGHTGSPLDEPAKTLKAGDHGVPGGENTLLLPNGEVRYFTVRECARLQTFSDEFLFCGSWTETMRQLGNAVPVELAHRVALSMRDCLNTIE